MKIQELQPEAKITAYYYYEQIAFAKAAEIKDQALTKAKAVLASAGAKNIRIVVADTFKPLFEVIAYKLENGDKTSLNNEVLKIMRQHRVLAADLLSEEHFMAWAADKDFTNEGDLIF